MFKRNGFKDFKETFILWLKFLIDPSYDSWFIFWVNLNTAVYYDHGEFMKRGEKHYIYMGELNND